MGYAPPFGSTRDPVNIVGFVAANILRGDVKTTTWDRLPALDRGEVLFLDVRNPPELLQGAIEGAVNIPLGQLRARIDELPKDKPILVYCQAGQRAYFACRALAQRGYDVTNLSGGYKTYSFTLGPQSNFDVFEQMSIGPNEEIRATAPGDE